MIAIYAIRGKSVQNPCITNIKYPKWSMYNYLHLQKSSGTVSLGPDWHEGEKIFWARSLEWKGI